VQVIINFFTLPKALTQVANIASENDPCELYNDRLASVEILRVLLLLIIEPSPQNTPPHLTQVMLKATTTFTE
jgi:hypothetical protein